MAKILIINPSKWGRGITPIWISSHVSLLKSRNHEVKLFDATFYFNWSHLENTYNTNNKQYRETDYEKKIRYNYNDIKIDLQKVIDNFKPNIIFWSALSSHIHGEGEYVNIQYGYELIENLQYGSAILITGGIQPTASPKLILSKFKKLDFVITGESEFVLEEFSSKFKNKEKIVEIKGLNYFYKKKLISGEKQQLIHNLDLIPKYDYSLFEDQIFLRPYNGKVLRVIDYELSRGCIYTCSYCVETVIQNYYGFSKTSKKGALLNAKNYLRSKSATRIYEELSFYKKKFKLDLIRCQDTNFLTINKKVLKNLEKLIMNNPLGLKLYVETRPEGINENTAQLLKNLNVDGVGMGIELAGQNFREDELNRFANQEAIINAFKILKKYQIKRTSYNIIGLPNQNEMSIKKTIDFNRALEPDNVTVAFYSPYLGTYEQKKSKKLEFFDEYENNVDGQLRTVVKNYHISIEKLKYYKNNFTKLVMKKNSDDLNSNYSN